ncbi:hypothetical protein DFH08DRAFT_870005 [Mycena albidolilacea]|uniref:DUF6534 domain-containing protein n=1 Tax=Mycena albidolilacea TaxID=1033008 RepID=A0AAD7A1A5_9AGAR|nr:hypothetical protein DFH08DRAFT_870005 [Mycena albidolilacea]
MTQLSRLIRLIISHPNRPLIPAPASHLHQIPVPDNFPLPPNFRIQLAFFKFELAKSSMPSIAPTLGASLVGTIISVFLYGVTSLQTFLYFQMYSQKDTWSLQGAVLLLWLFETAHSALACSVIFRLLILNFGDFAALEMAGVSDEMVHLMLACIIFIVHCFYVHRLWMFTRNIFLAAIVVVLIFCHFAFQLVTLAVVIIFPKISDFHKPTPYFATAMVLAAVSDLIIAITMTVYLKRQQSTIRLRRTNTLVNQLVGYIVSSGVLTSIIDILALATFFAMPNNLVYIGILNFVNNLYANSMLTMLNARGSLRSGMDVGETDIDINLTGTPANMHEPSVIFLNNRTGTIVQSTTEYRAAGSKPDVV